MPSGHPDGFRPPKGWGGADDAVPSADVPRADVPAEGEPGWREVAAAASTPTDAEPSTQPVAQDPAPRGASKWWTRRRPAEHATPSAPLTATQTLTDDEAAPPLTEGELAADATVQNLAQTVHHQMLTLIVVAAVAVLAVLALVLNRTVPALKPEPTSVTTTATVRATATATPVTLSSASGFAANAVSDVRFGTVALPASQTIESSEWGPTQADTQLESGIEVIVGLLNSLATATPGATPTDSTTAPAPATPTTTANTYPYGIPSPAGTLSAAARRWIITQDNAAIDRGGSGMRTMTSGYTAWCARSSGQPTRTGEGCFYPTQGGISFIWVWTPPPVTDDVRAGLLNSYVPGF